MTLSHCKFILYVCFRNFSSYFLIIFFVLMFTDHMLQARHQEFVGYWWMDWKAYT